MPEIDLIKVMEWYFLKEGKYNRHTRPSLPNEQCLFNNKMNAITLKTATLVHALPPC